MYPHTHIKKIHINKITSAHVVFTEIPKPVNNDICYAAMVDKRYNRWKRRRRKRTRGESITPVKPASPCESSSEEIQATPAGESSPVTLKLRRHKPEETEVIPSATSHELHYDGSSEMVVSDKEAHHSMCTLNEYTHNKSSETKDPIEEHQGRIQAAIEQTAKGIPFYHRLPSLIGYNNKAFCST